MLLKGFGPKHFNVDPFKIEWRGVGSNPTVTIFFKNKLFSMRLFLAVIQFNFGKSIFYEILKSARILVTQTKNGFLKKSSVEFHENYFSIF